LILRIGTNRALHSGSRLLRIAKRCGRCGLLETETARPLAASCLGAVHQPPVNSRAWYGKAGLHSPWVSGLPFDLEYEVYVANPRRLRAIYENENKSDRVDAQYLARIGRLDPFLLSPLRHRSAETQADLSVIRARASLMKVRSALVNFVRGVVKSAGAASLVVCQTLKTAAEAE